MSDQQFVFASQNLTAGQLNALVKKVGGHDGAVYALRNDVEIRLVHHDVPRKPFRVKTEVLHPRPFIVIKLIDDFTYDGGAYSGEVERELRETALNVILDLTDVTKLDASGIAMLMGVYTYLHDLGRLGLPNKVRLVTPPPKVYAYLTNKLEEMRLSDYFEFFDGYPEACRSYSSW